MHGAGAETWENHRLNVADIWGYKSGRSMAENSSSRAL